MRKWILGIIAIGAATAVVTELTPTRGAENPTVKSYSTQFREGEPFPTMLFPSLGDGRPASVADFRGKKLILHIFASW